MFSSIPHALRSYPVDVRRIIAVSAMMGFTIDGVFPVVFNLYILRMGFGPDFVGMVNSVALLVFSLGSLPAGAIGMRVGTRNTMVAGVLISLVSTLALSVSDLLPAAWHAPWLMTMFSMLYLGVALYFVNSSPAVVNLTPSSERARVISVQSALGNLMAFVGGPMAGFIPVLVASWLGWSLADAGAYRVPMLVSGGVYLLALALILRVAAASGNVGPAHEEPSGERGAPQVAIAFGSTLVMLSLIRFLQAAPTGSALTFFNVYMDDGLGVSPQYIGLMVAAARLLSVFAALVVPVLVRRLGSANAAVAGAAVSGLSLAPLALIPLWPVGGLSYMALNAATSVRYSAFFVYMMGVTPPRLRTTIAGAGEFAGGMSFAAVSFVGGLAIVRYGYTEQFLAAGAIGVAGALLQWGYAQWRQRVEGKTVAAVTPAALVENMPATSTSPGTPLPEAMPAGLAPAVLAARADGEPAD